MNNAYDTYPKNKTPLYSVLPLLPECEEVKVMWHDECGYLCTITAGSPSTLAAIANVRTMYCTVTSIDYDCDSHILSVFIDADDSEGQSC